MLGGVETRGDGKKGMMWQANKDDPKPADRAHRASIFRIFRSARRSFYDARRSSATKIEEKRKKESGPIPAMRRRDRSIARSEARGAPKALPVFFMQAKLFHSVKTHVNAMTIFVSFRIPVFDTHFSARNANTRTRILTFAKKLKRPGIPCQYDIDGVVVQVDGSVLSMICSATPGSLPDGQWRTSSHRSRP